MEQLLNLSLNLISHDFDVVPVDIFCSCGFHDVARDDVDRVPLLGQVTTVNFQLVPNSCRNIRHHSTQLPTRQNNSSDDDKKRCASLSTSNNFHPTLVIEAILRDDIGERKSLLHRNGGLFVVACRCHMTTIEARILEVFPRRPEGVRYANLLVKFGTTLRLPLSEFG